MTGYRRLLLCAYRSHFVLLLLLTTLGGCGSALVEHPCFEMSPGETVYFVVDSSEPRISKDVELAQGLGHLYLCAGGHVDAEGNYVLTIYTEAYGDDHTENLRFEPQNVRALVGDEQMQLVSTSKWGDEFNTSSWLIDLRCPASNLEGITSEDTEDQHIVIVIDLSSYVFIDDDAISFEPIRAVQKRPLPQRK